MRKFSLGLAVILTFTSALTTVHAQLNSRGGKIRPIAEPTVTLPSSSLAKLSPALRVSVSALPNDTDSVGLTIVSFNTALGLSSVTDLFTPVTGLLARNGVALAASARLEGLGMIAVVLTKAQLAGLAAEPSVLSIWDNYRLHYGLHQARVLCGVDKLRADAALTARNGGKVVDGAGDGAPVTGQPNRPQFSVVVIDSGISTSGGGPVGGGPDLYYDNSSAGVIDPVTKDHYTVPPTIPASKIIQNVQVTANVVSGNTSLTYTENQLENDSVGHGSHCSGIVGGTGAFSKANGEDFSGVAPGVKIVGCGSGAGLFVLDALGGMNYAINFQQFYNVRITSNSYGSDGPYDPADPLNVAIKSAYDHNITTVFAAGNSGPGVDTIGIQAKSPYVISVAAGTKEGGLASFSSRGKPVGERAAGSVDEFNLPAITAPGTGREFLFDGPNDPASMSPYVNGVNPNPDTVGKKFYSDIVSTRSKVPGAAAGLNDQEFPAQYAPVYTMISGTSMACPFVAGTCALLLDADPTLTPAGIKSILQATATHLPDYQDFEVGAGYLNAYAAVDMAFNPSKPYKPFNRVDQPYAAAYPPFVTNINTAPLAATGRPTGYLPATVTEGSATLHDEDYTQPFNPQSVSAADYAAAKVKATTRDNAYAFLVDANPDGTPKAGLTAAQVTTMLDARIQFGNDPVGLGVGNTIGLLLWAPDGSFYSSGIALPVEDAANRQVVVKNPLPGLWVAEFRGIRGLAAVPITPPTGVGLPDTVNGQIYRTNNAITNPPGDTGGILQQEAINFALLNRYLDQPASGAFMPTGTVSRATFAQVLADNVPLRQSLATGTTPYTDTTGVTARFAEAAAQNGSSARDWDFTPGPTLATNSGQFSPNTNITRFQVALAFVRALGFDAEALKLSGTSVKVTYQGNLIPVTDALVLSPAQRGYLQLALNRGLISYLVQFNSSTGTYTAVANPSKNIARADLATAVVNFRSTFRVGNSLLATEYAPQP